MLPKAHLTSHPGCLARRVITPLWLSGSWRYFLYSSSVYSCHLFLISSASVRSILFLPFIEPIFAWNFPLVSLIFLKRSLLFIFFYAFTLITEEGFLISLCYSLELCIQMGISSFSPLLFTSLLFTAICNGMSFIGMAVVLREKARMIFYIRNVKSEEQKGRLKKKKKKKGDWGSCKIQQSRIPGRGPDWKSTSGSCLHRQCI